MKQVTPVCRPGALGGLGTQLKLSIYLSLDVDRHDPHPSSGLRHVRL